MFRKKRSVLEKSFKDIGVDASKPLGKFMLELMIDKGFSNYSLTIKTYENSAGFQYDFCVDAFRALAGDVMQTASGECFVWARSVNAAKDGLRWDDVIAIHSKYDLFGRPLDNV